MGTCTGQNMVATHDDECLQGLLRRTNLGTWRILATSPALAACRNWLVRSASWRANVCCTTVRTRSRLAIACGECRRDISRQVHGLKSMHLPTSQSHFSPQDLKQGQRLDVSRDVENGVRGEWVLRDGGQKRGEGYLHMLKQEGMRMAPAPVCGLAQGCC